MLSRLKFDLSEIVKDMFSDVPNWLLTSDTTTFVDIQAAGLQLILPLVDLLRSYGHSDENIKKRVFAVMENEVYLNYVQYKNPELPVTFLIYNEIVDDMKFDCVITNPPYNSERGDNNQSVDIYPEFIDKAYNLTNRYVIMITKSNWMNKPSMKSFRDRMINEYNVDKIVHYEQSPFDGADIKGGVSYFVIDNENTKETFELNGIVYDRSVALDFLPYALSSEELDVLSKLFVLDKYPSSNYRSKGYYDIKSNDSRFLDSESPETIRCYVSALKGRIKYLDRNTISEKGMNDLHKYKVFTPSSAGSTENPYVIGDLIKGYPGDLCSESLVSWVFDTEDDMLKWYDYMNTKIVRFSISCIKTKHDVSKNSFSLIPYIDLNLLSNIDDVTVLDRLGIDERHFTTINDRCSKYVLIK